MSTTKTSTTIYSILIITLTLTVKGHDVYLRFHKQPEKNSCHLPEELHATLEKDEKYYNLTLLRNDDIDLNLPVFVISKDNNGESKFKHQQLRTDKSIAVYQDLENGAAVLIQCINEVSETDGHFRLDGHLHLESKHYRVEPYLTNGRIFQHPQHVDKHAYNISIQEESHACPLDKKQGKTKAIPAIPLFESLNRHKRSTTPYILDIAIHVDKTAYETWLRRSAGDAKKAKFDIRRYFTHVMNVVNMRYQTLKPEVDITIRPFKITIHEENTPFIDDLKENRNGKIEVNAEAVLGNLTQWIKENSQLVDPYDHIMLFTGYNLYSTGNEELTTGLATVGTMCKTDGTSISVVEDKGGFQSIYISAHELGHGLDSLHDGEENACKAADRYIMAPRNYNETKANALHPWSFSSCSKNYISRYIEKHMNESSFASCVNNKINDFNIPDISNQTAGQMYGPDEQCRHYLGSKSYVCREKIFGNETDVCRRMFCNEPGSNKCSEIVPAFGTSCGNKKWCEGGVCRVHDAAPSREGTCIYGDYDGTMSVGDDTVSCATIRSEKNYYCYQETITHRCCDTCLQVKTNNSVCLYGDKKVNCSKENCGKKLKVTHVLYDIDCCKTCNYDGDVPIVNTEPPSTTSQPTTTSTDCRDVISVNLQTCTEFLDRNGDRQCYKNDTESSCCKSCYERRLSIPNCRYGDKIDNCKPEGCDTTAGSYSHSCCKTCAKLESKTTEKSETTQTTPMTTTQACTDSSIENMECHQYIQKHGKSKCYSSNVKKSCCSTCKLYENPSKQGCEYGDEGGSACDSINVNTRLHICTNGGRSLCCDKCSQLDAKMTNAGLQIEFCIVHYIYIYLSIVSIRTLLDCLTERILGS